MRMKEVCTRTGLTDRAVRLYMESGLITPACERSYSGRAAIHFSEADIAALETVATLRRAGFAIAEIAAMQADPACIPVTVEARCSALGDEIAAREATLAALGKLAPAAMADVDTLAAGLRPTAPSISIPREDTSMSIREINRILRTRLAAVLALVAAAVGIVNLARLTYAGCFVSLQLRQGGGYDPIVDYALCARGEVLLAWLPMLLVTAGTALLFGYIAAGRRWTLLSAMGCMALGAALIFAMPAGIAQRISLQEFLDYRYSILHRIYWNNNSEVFLTVLRLFKFVPFLLSLACSACALVRHRSGE